jgi:serine/threonine protein phosphatase PrpC
LSSGPDNVTSGSNVYEMERQGGAVTEVYSITSASLTETGKVREINEDAVLEAGNIFAVADGMGGHQAGEVASDLALGVIGQYIEDNLGLIGGEKLVEKAVQSANATVHQKAESSAKYRAMGTTVTVLYREGDTAYIGNVGDSRAYLLRGGNLRRLTSDHSLVAALIEEGEITEEQSRSHPQRNIILRALGLEGQIEVDVVSVRIEPGDEFLLTTDGLTGLVEDKEITAILAQDADPVTQAGRLVDAAMQAGGTDNISVVLARFMESNTVVPARAAKQEEPQSDTGEGQDSSASATKGRRRWNRGRILIWTVIAVVLVVILGSAFGAAAYFYNRTYYVGAKRGNVTMFKGFPFWDLGTVVKRTDTEVRFLPEVLRRRVEGKLDPQSRSEAEKTLKWLEREAAKNSVVVPSVTGKKYSEVKAELEKLGLRIELDLVSVQNVPSDTVIEQDPAPGTRMGVGSQVKLKVNMQGAPAREV